MFISKSFFKKLNENWNKKSPKQKWQMVYDIANKCSEIVGIRFLSDNQRNWRGIGCAVLLVYFYSTLIYTLVYYGSNGRFLTGFRCLCLLGIMTADTIMFIKAMTSEQFKFKALAKFAGDSIYQEQNLSKLFDKLLSIHIKKLLKEIRSIILIMFFSYTIIASGPVYIYFAKGAKFTIFQTKLPFFEENSDTEFYVNASIQGVIAVAAVFGNVALEIVSCLINNTIELTSGVIELNIQTLRGKLKEGKNNFNLESKMLFRNILIQIQDYNWYVKLLIDVYGEKFFAGSLAFAFSISLAIFYQIVMDYPIGYTVAIVSYTQLIIMCYMGLNVQIANKRICNGLADIECYRLPIKGQIDVIIALKRMQNAAVLRVGALFPLNAETVSTLTKKIYSFLMCLINFVE